MRQRGSTGHVVDGKKSAAYELGSAALAHFLASTASI